MEKRNANLPAITNVMMVLTHACNSRCQYCFECSKPDNMSYQVAYDTTRLLIKNAEDAGVTPGINFFGGEPMLRWDDIIKPLTLYIRNQYGKPFSLSMTTNGVLLTDEALEFIKQYGISMLFSCDGDRETQEYNRPLANGESSFEAVSPLFPKLLAVQPNITFRMTTIPPTCGNLFHDIQFAANTGFKRFYVVPNVFEEWSAEARETLSCEMDQYFAYYIQCYRNGVEPIQFDTFEKTFSDIKSINYACSNHCHRCLQQCSSSGKCGLGSNRFASIHPNGDVFACQEMTSNADGDSIFCIGNIYTGVDDACRNNLMALFDASPSVGQDCDNCLYNSICDGGCVANNYMISGDMNVVPEIYCWWKKLLLDGAIRIMQILGSEENALFKQKWEGIHGR